MKNVNKRSFLLVLAISISGVCSAHNYNCWKIAGLFMQAAGAAAQLSMTKIATTTAAGTQLISAIGVVHMGSNPPDHVPKTTKERVANSNAAIQANAIRAEEDQKAASKRRLDKERERNGGKTDGEIAYEKEQRDKKNREASIEKARKNVNQMNQEIKRGQAPNGIKRVDSGIEVYAGVPHVHFDDGTALNVDGTIHDKKNGTPRPTKKQALWLLDNGWTVPGFVLRGGRLMYYIPGQLNIWRGTEAANDNEVHLDLGEL